MNKKIIAACVLTGSIASSCSTTPAQPDAASSDPYGWLEEIRSPRSLEWVKSHNARSQAELTADARFEPIRDEIHAVLVAKDRIPAPTLRGGWIYNFWQDADHVKGLWRRARPEEYAKKDPAWEIVLDLDALAKKEGESWVWKGVACLPPEYGKCLLSLSRGGKDAVVVREFDIGREAFVPEKDGGFHLPEAKSEVGWMDSDTIWVGTDFGPGSLTASGYPRIAKLWRRGTPLASAKQVFEGKRTDVSAGGSTLFSPEGRLHVLARSPSFFESEEFLYRPETGAVTKIPFPSDANPQGVFQGQLLALLRSDWTVGISVFRAGSLVAMPVSEIAKAVDQIAVTTVYAPDSRSAIEGVSRSSDALYLSTLENVKGRILKATRSASGEWRLRRLRLPDNGSAGVAAASEFDRRVFVDFEGFLKPMTLYSYGGDGARPTPVKRLPARFDASGFEVSQHEAVSLDGTRVPYFLVRKKGLPFDGKQPTLLYGYGGFEVSETPHYLGAMGKAWLERGGAYALANIRGGGEFGPKWHEAAILGNRQRAYDDFIAAAGDLIRLHVTRPDKLGIMGGSNGGLLMGVMATQRPDLFKAIVCQVPLLDMLRYHKLLAGASWMGEYGNPDDPAMAQVISRYSPYQRVRPEIKYPRIYFETSTEDDRVHPGHARKMAAKMEAQGHRVLYFENMEGGHSAAADLEQRTRRSAMEYVYLWRELTGP